MLTHSQLIREKFNLLILKLKEKVKEIIYQGYIYYIKIIFFPHRNLFFSPNFVGSDGLFLLFFSCFPSFFSFFPPLFSPFFPFFFFPFLYFFPKHVFSFFFPTPRGGGNNVIYIPLLTTNLFTTHPYFNKKNCNFWRLLHRGIYITLFPPPGGGEKEWKNMFGEKNEGKKGGKRRKKGGKREKRRKMGENMKKR